jgi:hypothetical protein
VISEHTQKVVDMKDMPDMRARQDSVEKRSRFSRRELLKTCSTGFGAMALSAMMAEAARANASSTDLPAGAALRKTHHQPKAKHVIFLYMSGGVSHVDSFDPKPRLMTDHGKPMPVKIQRTMFNNNGNIMGSPFAFQPWGESGIPVSEMFPHVAKVVDELAVIRSMTSSVNEHAQANFLMHTGFPLMGYPSAGAWASYGLGSESSDLPGYVVLQSGAAVPPHAGAASRIYFQSRRGRGCSKYSCRGSCGLAATQARVCGIVRSILSEGSRQRPADRSGDSKL